ncbi:MAG: hypothetical protein HC901_00785 [Bdellovibrionaceae bacterium]|nr:hypothetical protein [Pseudobdellovibrionaceae bacterium]
MEIVLTAYNQETARKIGDRREDWDRASDLPATGLPANPAEQLRNREAQLFRTRISLK